MTFLRRMLDHLRGRSAAEPDNAEPDAEPDDAVSPEHQKTLDRADALLDDPRVGVILAERQRRLRESFARTGRRLGGR